MRAPTEGGAFFVTVTLDDVERPTASLTYSLNTYGVPAGTTSMLSAADENVVDPAKTSGGRAASAVHSSARGYCSWVERRAWRG
jgi:hypothetical protein